MALLGRARTASGKQPGPGKSERTLRKGGLTNRAEAGGRAEANGGAVPQGSLLPGGSAGAKPGAACIMEIGAPIPPAVTEGRRRRRGRRCRSAGI